ncbi:hypothetical protein ERJ75_000986500 [Trypanosoma vivax]|uniref:Transportin2-like protein n=1 Tax=Trypanosoma vivax (strain Y486) TaxID=1055687 RepID=G0U739_TRYVY|nr:hypothetical protein TRVL_01274 [Trypanosoma vivax]KAH8611643.1 hypothetical protein ERJ75_000986500 [Trypanosoma vivax]CCC51696.1 conserved hypothetical protein [Trypanosoma vivax Y486]
MNVTGNYSVVPNDVINVLRLLHDNGVSVQNSKKAYEELLQYQANSDFCVLLSHIFGAETCPIPNMELGGSWLQYRRLAGITLKNNLERSKYALGEAAVKEAAARTLFILVNPTDIRIVRVAAQIVVKITGLTSFDWWEKCGFGNLPVLLLNDLLNGGELKTFAALYVLQYLVEDLPKVVGVACKDILERVGSLVAEPGVQESVRKAAFRMCFNMYDHAQQLDWNVDGLSPLQHGLTSASLTFAGICTTLLEQGCGGDTILMIEVLRSCCLMLDYLEYFTPLSDAVLEKIVNWWIRNTICIISANAESGNDIQLKIVSMDLLTAAMNIYDQMGGEGYVCALVQPIVESLSILVPALVNFVPMSKEDIENSLSGDDYRIRDPTSVRIQLFKRNNDISESTLFDDEHVSATLRSSALRCIDSLCVLSSQQTFPHLIERVRVLWDAQWELKEAAIVLVGTMANGCYSEIEATLPAVSQQLLTTVLSPSDNIFVVSMAMWSLSRILEWAYTSDGTTLTNIINAFISRLGSTSKRVQLAAVTALNAVFTIGHNMGLEQKVAECLPNLVDSVIKFLPIYYDGNLSVLCDLVLQMLATVKDCNAIAHIYSSFRSCRLERARTFENTYTAYYVNDVPNVDVDRDVFSIDRVIAGYLTRYQDPNISIGFMTTWEATLRDVIERNIKDDVGLIVSILQTCQNFLNATPSSALSEWSCKNQGSLAFLTFQIFNATQEPFVQTVAASLLHRILKNAGSYAIPEQIREVLMNALATSVPEVEDLGQKLEMVRLIVAMVNAYSNVSENVAPGAFLAAVGELRADAYSDSLWYFAQMAHEICSAFECKPGLIARCRPDIIARIMAQCENTHEKSAATKSLVNALLVAEETAVVVLPDALRLICSWQQAASNFPGTHESLQSLLLFYNSKHSELLREHLHSINPSLHGMLLSTYGMS